MNEISYAVFQKQILKNDPNQNYNFLTDKFLLIVNKHAPLKKKFVRGKMHFS